MEVRHGRKRLAAALLLLVASANAFVPSGPLTAGASLKHKASGFTSLGGVHSAPASSSSSTIVRQQQQQQQPSHHQCRLTDSPWASSTCLQMVAAEPIAAPGVGGEEADPVAAYVKKRGGSLPIRRVLIANNGMAGTKAILSMRQWAYLELGDEKAIEFVVMATPEDLNANAEFIRLADSIAEVPGGSNRNNYANVELIVETAKKEGVDAVWPGWGHASENPKLPTQLAAAGIKFIGPTAPVMSVLGDKIAANILAQTANVPSIPWSGQGLKAELTAEGTIPPETFAKATVKTVDEAIAAAKKIGFPVMVKASEGGGGKGIRMSNNEAELRTHFVQVGNEVVGSPIFMMQLCTGARHIEVQIVGDEHGNAVALNGRDCSTQRRFQKIFEEGPPVIVPTDMFTEMERAAQRLTQNIGYRGAGTVEYLYNPKDNKFYFLELNPRLQVEHPVTEGLTNANIPSVQLQVAMGIPLYKIPDIRQFYGLDRYGDSPIDFMTEKYPPIRNHVIAARITAENPDEGFKPTSGSIERVKFQSTPSVWGYFSVGANGGIHEYADSQFGHLFASAPTREAARKNLILALKEIEVRGEIRTTVEYLVQLLETEEFKQNTIDTSWLDGLIRAKSVGIEVEPHDVVTSAVIYRAWRNVGELMKGYEAQLEKGQTGLIGLKGLISFPIDISFEGVKYSFQVSRAAKDVLQLTVNGQVIDVRVRAQPDGSLMATFGGSTRLIFGQEEPLGLRLVLDGKTCLMPNIFDPSELRSDITGKVVRYLQEDGDEVKVGDPFVEVEAMKMIMPLKATESGKVTHTLSQGSIISAGDLLATLELQDPTKVKKIVPFVGTLNIENDPIVADDGAALMTQLSMAMKGFEVQFEPLVQGQLFNLFEDPNILQAELVKLFNQYYEVESRFAGEANPDDVVTALIKANKEKPQVVVEAVLQHQQLAQTNKLMLSLLRALASFQDAFGDWNPSKDLLASLEKLADLPGKEYGQVVIEATALIEELKAAPFGERVDNLRDELVSSTDLGELAGSPSISVGVDMLSALFDDPDFTVRAKAMEVYIRRAYRSHVIESLTVSEQGGLLTCEWSFRFGDTPPKDSPTRYGLMTVMRKYSDCTSDKINVLVDKLKGMASGQSAYVEPINVLSVAFMESPPMVTDKDLDAMIKSSEAMLKANINGLKSAQTRQVSFMFHRMQQKPRYLAFKSCDNYSEDPLRRDMRPSFPYIFELSRLSVNYNLERMQTLGRNSQIYLGEESGSSRFPAQTLFLRAVSHRTETYVPEGAERALLSALDELERAMQDPRVKSTASSRIFLYMMPVLEMTPEQVLENFRETMGILISKHATRLLNLRIDELEVKIRVSMKDDEGKPIVQPLRMMASSMSGEWLRVDGFLEYPDPVTGVTKQFCSLSAENNICLLNPYPLSNNVQNRRAAARRIGTTYAYDFLGLIEVSLINEWQAYLKDLSQASTTPVNAAMPANIFDSQELVMQEDGSLKREFRIVGSNRIGMLAWHMVLKTPTYPEGREVVMIANDVTFQSGSFGVQEDDFFKAASEYARKQGLPRIYMSSNSGARIGLVDELKPKFKVAFINEQDPTKGFKYLYLAEDDYKRLPKGMVNAKEVTEGGETRYELVDIIGLVHGIGVENLRGSGLIAGETARAYDQTFTLSYVTGRSVGIGAYLNRLGQRVIQMKTGPMILTGFGALNKLLGKEVYTSQDQLGGPQVMGPNGVSHLVVEDDKEGVMQVLKWLSFIPKTAHDPSPQTKIVDPVERKIAFTPTKAPYDPREMCAGKISPDGQWISGFFDRGSYQEYLAGWGKSVIVGRARLGGIPMGVINVETRLSEQRIPADPANPESREQIMPQAGQVWFPDSAYKTATALRDFNHAENLPVIIFANWRGFSGGTRDMYGEILKFGAQIVDELVDYKHPVFVYIPPAGELRGGAWVVIDPTINEEVMEMYADVNSRGGILEPPGICEVKFRTADQIAKMHSTDSVLKQLDAELELASTIEDSASIKKRIKEREDTLGPLYMQIAHEFADLHDRAGRMKAKGVIRDIVEWPHAREYFYWRVKRRLSEMQTRKQFKAADSKLTYHLITAELQALCPGDWEDDKVVLDFLESNGGAVGQRIKELTKASLKRDLAAKLIGLSAEDKASILSSL